MTVGLGHEAALAGERRTSRSASSAARRLRDRAAALLIAGAALLALAPLVSLLWQVVSHGAPELSASFLTSSMRNVVGPGGGIVHAVWGTLLVTAAATAISVPIGLLAAIYLVEYAGRLSGPITVLIDVMTGIPSIVAGLFAYAAFALVFGPGVRMGVAGAVALAVLMVPLVVRSAQESIRLVPGDLREASYALGVGRARTVTKVVLATGRSGIVTGIAIAVARVIGETAPLLLVCGATDSTNLDLTNGRMMTLPVFIYSQYKDPGFPPQVGIDRAWGAALVLTVLVVLISVGARWRARTTTSSRRS